MKLGIFSALKQFTLHNYHIQKQTMKGDYNYFNKITKGIVSQSSLDVKAHCKGSRDVQSNINLPWLLMGN